MSDLTDRIAALSSKKRELLMHRLKQQAKTSLIPLIHTQKRETDTFPLSFAQQRIWILEQLVPGTGAYIIPLILRLSGELHPDILECSLNEIMSRHEVLRTYFDSIDGNPVQLISSHLVFPLSKIDLSVLSQANRETQLRQTLLLAEQQPFDLSRGPLIRAILVQLDPKEHMLLLSMHHIISDGWSVTLLLRELSVLYNAYCKGTTSLLPKLPIQYADFALWQRQWLQGTVLETHLNYWKHQLAGAPSLLPLPTDRSRLPVQTFRGASVPCQLSSMQTQALKTLSQEMGVTLFMTLLAAFQVLLSHYSAQDDIVVGTPIANRTQREVETLIGCFVNTLVMRTDLSGNPSFRQLLQRVREVALEAYTYQDVPFEKLVETLHPERTLNHNPLFQVFFVLQDSLPNNLDMTGINLSYQEVESTTAKFDLSLELTETQEGLQGHIEYCTDLFDAGTITRMMEHWYTLLEGIVHNPDLPIRYLPLLTDAERQQVLFTWNATDADYPKQYCLHQLFEQQVQCSPEAIAVVMHNEQWSYRVLNSRANQLARYLHTLGVGPEKLVGLCLERSVEMVVALLAILKTGGAYVPLDPQYPKERLTFMLVDADVTVLLTQQRLLPNLPASQAPVLRLEDALVQMANYDESNFNGGAGLENLAYVIYTSGSTGTPKGVAVQHQSVMNFFTGVDQHVVCQETDELLAVTSISFDISIMELLWPLTHGAKIILVRDSIALQHSFMSKSENTLPIEEFANTSLEEHSIEHLFTTHAVSILQCTPSMMKMFLFNPTIRKQMQSVKTLILGGEVLPVTLATEILQTLPARLFNMYGPTETTIWSTVTEIKSDAYPVIIGRPIANTQIYLLDESLQPVAIGVVGELYIGGTGLARGYLHRPDLTARRFIPHPFSNQPGERLYRTGDLGRYRTSGNLEFLGRVDQQVKLRGFRIELGEIETALQSHPLVEIAVAATHEDVADDKRLVAYVVTNDAETPTSSELRYYLQQKLPAYMVPSVFLLIDALPVTPSGKIDRNALPEIEVKRPELEVGYVAPRSKHEKSLAAIWKEVLGIERVGVYDDFFELGGDSLRAMQIISKCDRAGLPFTLQQLIQAKTIAALASMPFATRSVHAEQGLVMGTVPLTPMQQRFFDRGWFEPQMCTMGSLFEVQKVLNPQHLQEAVRQLVLHHDALRLRFIHDASGWRQFHAASEDNILFFHRDLATLTNEEQDKAMTIMANEMRGSLSMETGPLIRVALFTLGSRRLARVLLVLHHVVVDDVSEHILLEDLETACGQISREELIRFPKKTTSFKYWAERLVTYAHSPDLAQELDYWLQLAKKPLYRLPVDYPQGNGLEEKNKTNQYYPRVTVSLSADEVQTLTRKILPTLNVQLRDVLLTALVHAFSQWTGRSQLPIRMPGHGRDPIFEDVELARTVGWINTSVPLVIDIEGATFPKEALIEVRKQLSQVPSKGIGYNLLRYIREESEVKDILRTFGRKPEVSFNYVGWSHLDQLETPLFIPVRETMDLDPDIPRTTEVRISGAIDSEHGLQFSWVYNSVFYRRSTIEKIAWLHIEAIRAFL